MSSVPSATAGMHGIDINDWWGVSDREALDCLAEQGTMALDQLAHALRLSEGEATSLVAMLARAGKIRIRQVELAA